MDDTQPSFYQISDPLQNLQIEVTLKKVAGFTKKNKDQESKDDDDPSFSSKKNSAKSPEPTIISKSLRWQQKVFGPREIAIFSPGDEDGGSASNPRLTDFFKSSGSGSGIVESDYKEQFLEMAKDGKDLRSVMEEQMVFTYVDKDGFAPKASLQPKLTTSNSMDTNVSQNPLGLAHSSMPLRQLQAGVLPQATLDMQAHLSREQPFKIMYIMAAVDCDVEEMKLGAKDKKEEHIYGGTKALGGPRFYEKVLCSIKMYQNGTMEATPGLSEDEPEDEDMRTFASTHSLNVRQKEGAKLTTFRFTTPKGSVYEYSLENKNAVDVVTSERMAQEQAEKDRRKVEERRNRQGEFFFGAPNTHDVPFFLHTYVEIVSASGFADDGGLLYSEYEVTTPNGWTGVNQCPGTNWGGVKPEDKFLKGTTQLARPVYLKNKMGGGAGKAFGTNSAPRGDSMNEGETGKFLGVILMLSVVLGLLLGEKYMFWLFAALILVTTVLGVSPTGQYDRTMAEPVYHFGYPTSLHLAPPSDYFSDPVALSQSPTMLFQVSSKHNFQRHVIEGYGYVKMPTAPGMYDFVVKTWVPVGGVRSEVRNFFIGGAYRLHTLASVVMSSESGGASFLSKFGLRTVTSGSLRVRMHVVAHKQVLQDDREGSEASQTQDLNNRSSIDNILSRVKAARSGRGESGSPSRRSQMAVSKSANFESTGNSGTTGKTGTTGTTGTTEDDNLTGFERTNDVLERVKARREARAKQSKTANL